MSKLTPIDLPHQQFTKSFMGYHPREVLKFLQEISVEWEETLKENKQLRDKLEDQHEEVKRLLDNEKMLKETLLTAQKMSDQLNANAKKESELMIGQAEMQAEKILQQAHDRLTEVIQQINDVKRQRAEFHGTLRGIIETHLKLLSMEVETKESRIEHISILPKASASS